VLHDREIDVQVAQLEAAADPALPIDSAGHRPVPI
jgi:hypothetical protein